MKNDLQKEIEELSWEFMVEVEEKVSEQEDGIFLSEEETEEKESADDSGETNDQQKISDQQDNELHHIYSNDSPSFFSTPNDWNRNSGIIFDEKKLENIHITDWSKAPPLRQPKIKKNLRHLFRVFTSLFKLLYEVISSFWTGFLWLFKNIFYFLFSVIKNIIIFPWRLLQAFGQSFVYLFGDFSWFKRESALVKVAVTSDPLPFSRPKAIGGFILVSFLLIAPFGLYQFYREGQSIKGRVMGATSTGIEYLGQAAFSSTQFDFTAANQEFSLAEEKFKVAEDSFNQLGILSANIASLIPEVKTGQRLLLVAKNSAEIGQHLSRVVDVFSNLDISGPKENSLTVEAEATEQLTYFLKNNNLKSISQELELALTKAYAIQDVLPQIDLDNVGLDNYSDQFNQIKSGLPELTNSLENTKDIFIVLAHILGDDQPRRWMFIFANNSEIRPTLGFMGSYAIVDINHGAIENISVPGGGFYDLKGSLTAKVKAWYPFSVFSPYGQIWNSNYFPDFPASAKTIQWFYDKSGGPSVDGVIAFSPAVMEGLLDLTGEIDMPDYNTIVDSHNFVRMAQIEVELEYDKTENQPKQFIADLLPQVLAKVFSLKDEKLLDVAKLVSDNFSERQLLVYFNDSNIEKIASEYGWSGGVKQTDGDYLSVIHTNIAGGKTDRVIDVNISHRAEILDDGSILDTVTVTKLHNGQPDDVFEGQANTDYIRFYVPAGSKLLSAEGFDPGSRDRKLQIAGTDDNIEPDPNLIKYEKNPVIDPDTGLRLTNEFDKTCFAGWMITDPGQTRSVKISYLLPFKLSSDSLPEPKGKNILSLLKQYFFGKDSSEDNNPPEYVYSLLVQKQSGSENHQLEASLSLTGDWVISDFLPVSTDINSSRQNLSYSTSLETDKYYGVAVTASSR